jgi:DNA transformation protein
VDSEAVRELFAAFRPVVVRRLFGGAGLYAEGTMFALLADGAIYLKTDERTASAFVAEGLQPFTYQTEGGTRALASYRRMPDRLYDDPDELARWAEAALLAAQRAVARKLGAGSKWSSPAGKRPRRRKAGARRGRIARG